MRGIFDLRREGSISDDSRLMIYQTLFSYNSAPTTLCVARVNIDTSIDIDIAIHSFCFHKFSARHCVLPILLLLLLITIPSGRIDTTVVAFFYFRSSFRGHAFAINRYFPFQQAGRT